jgi:hypothetical protein
MPKRRSAETRKSVPLMSMVTEKLRQQVETLADRQKVTLSELGRRALQEYVEKSA